MTSTGDGWPCMAGRCVGLAGAHALGRPGAGRLDRAGPLLPPAREGVGRGPAGRQRPTGRHGVRGSARGAHPAERGHVLVRRALRPDQRRGPPVPAEGAAAHPSRAATRRRRTWPTRSSWGSHATCRRISPSATCASSWTATTSRPTTVASSISTAPSSASATGSATRPSPARSSRARPTRSIVVRLTADGPARLRLRGDPGQQAAVRRPAAAARGAAHDRPLARRPHEPRGPPEALPGPAGPLVR